MSILFIAVAHEQKIMANYASCDGNFMEIVEAVLSKIPSNDHKMTFTHGHYLFHYIVDNDYLYFCITAKACQRSRAFLFLNEIRRRFKLDAKDGFTPVLADEMYRYSEDYSTITIRKGELDELNTIGVGSSETILGEKILFVNNPEKLSFSYISSVCVTPQQVIISKDNSFLSNDDCLLSTDNLFLSGGSSIIFNESTLVLVNHSKLYFITITVILVLMWLARSIFGTIPTVIIICVFILAFMKLTKIDSKS